MHNAGHIQRDSSGMLVDIRVSANSYPCIHDWNADSKKDLIIGEIEHVLPDTGNIRVYINSGTNAEPVFRDYRLMQAGGGHLEVVHAHPVIIDLDNDSLKDLVCGNENGYVYFFKNRGTNEAPFFEAEYETLMTVDSVFIDGYTNSRIHYVDWTEDGDLDIILGGQAGYVWLCENALITPIQENRAHYTPEPFFMVLTNPVTSTALFTCSHRNIQKQRLDIYNITGQKVDEIPLHTMHSGTLRWHVPQDICSGVYFAVLESANGVFAEQLIVIR